VGLRDDMDIFGKDKYFAPDRIQISDRPAHSLVPCIPNTGFLLECKQGNTLN
jgi:hypothetical protein